MLVGDLGGDDRAPVAALGSVLLVAELFHQRSPEEGRALLAEAAGGRDLGEAVAGDRGGDDGEGVLGVAAVGGGIGQRAEDLDDLVEGAGPAMGEDQREGVGSVALLVDVVDGVVLDAVGRDLGCELGDAVEVGLLDAPIVLGAPVVAEFLHVGEVRAVLPARVGHFGGPAGLRESALEVADLGVGDVNLEWFGHVMFLSLGASPWLM